MNKADRIYLGKMFVDYSDAIHSTQQDIGSTTDMQKAIMEGLGIKDGRPTEINQYNDTLSRLIDYAFLKKNISLVQLMEFAEEYKTVSIVEYFELKNQITIKEEVENYLKI